MNQQSVRPDSDPSVSRTTEVEMSPKETAGVTRMSRLEEMEDEGWVDFRDQCRRQMQRPLDQRIKYGFCRMYKPVLDDAPWRAFETMSDYRAWCASQLPDYLGFKIVKP